MGIVMHVGRYKYLKNVSFQLKKFVEENQIYFRGVGWNIKI